MKYIALTITADRIGIAAGSAGFVASGSLPVDLGQVREQLTSVMAALQPGELRITRCGRQTAALKAVEAAAVDMARQFGVAVVHADRGTVRRQWLGAPRGTDGQLLDEADRREFRHDDLAEVEALASFDSALREDWPEAA